LNPHTFFLCFQSSKNICNPPPSVTKIAQFDEGVGKIWGVWCKEFSDEGIKNTLEFRAYNVCLIVSNFVFSNTKKFCKALIDTPIRFLITQNRLKMRKI
jgi:hypothetical protein